MEFNQQLNMARLFTTAVVSALVLVVLVLGTQAWFESAEATEADAKASIAGESEYAVLKDQQKASLHQYAWSNDKKTAATLPIDAAMSILVKDNGKMPSTQP